MIQHFDDAATLLMYSTVCTYSTLYSAYNLYALVCVAVVYKLYNRNTMCGYCNNWFEIGKFCAGAAGLVIFECVRNDLLHYAVAHMWISQLLVVNILMAVVSDATNTMCHLPNAVAGLMLIMQLPRSKDYNISHKLEWDWILCYTSWNAAFSYGFNYSSSTRVVLLAPILICVCMGDTNTWLIARTISMMLNMLWRWAQVSYLYDPARSRITNVPGTVVHSALRMCIWGVCNCVCMYMCS